MRERIRRPIILMMLLGVTILLTAFLYTLRLYRINQIEASISTRVASASEHFEHEVEKDALLMHGLLDFIERDEAIRQAWLAGDRQQLLDLTQPLFEQLESKYRVTDFQFHGAHRVNFLRVNSPDNHGDTIRRFTINNAHTTGKPAQGVELSPLGTLTLWVAHPWLIDGELVGYIELGEEVEHVMQQMQSIHGIDFVLLVNKQYLKAELWTRGLEVYDRNEQWDDYEQWAVMCRTVNMPAAAIEPCLEQEQIVHRDQIFTVKVQGNRYRLGFLPLIDAGGRDVGEMVILHNVTGQILATEKSMLITLTQALLVGAFLLAFFWLYLGKIERKLFSSRRKLNETRQQLINQNMQLGKKQEQLEQSHNALRDILAKVPFGVVLIDKKKKIRWLNNTVLKMIEEDDADNIIGKPCGEYLCSARQDKCPILDLEQTVDQSERILRRKDSKEIPIIKSVIEVNIDGEDMLLEAFVDNTERKRMEEEREQAQNFMQTVIDGLAENLMVVNLDHTIALANKGVRQLTGDPDPVSAGMKCHQIAHRSDSPCDTITDPCPIKELLATKAPVVVEHTHYDADGRAINVEIIASPIFNENGEVVQIIESTRNITERKQMEVELGQARKLESVGQLAAGIAHEVNTPAQFVSNNISFFRESMEDVMRLIDSYESIVTIAQERALASGEVTELEQLRDEVDWVYLKEEIPKAILQSQDGVDRISKIVRAMKEFSHPGKREKIPKNLNEIIDTTVIIARNEWKYVAELQLELLEDLPQVNCLVDEMGQVFLNIIVNAAHAIDDNSNGNGKGLIKISSTVQDEWVEIRIEDNGGGISASVREHIFDPFFTTKEIGKGTGQGLTIAYDVVTAKHNGKLYCETEEGVGTSFIVRLPLKEQEV
jgi:two-component system, NtrC family, sensor kinase